MAGGAPIGNRNRAGAARLTQLILEAVRENDWARGRAMAESIAKRAAKGDLQAAAFICDRLIGKPMLQLPDAGDGQLVLTWMGAAVAVSRETPDALPYAHPSETIDHAPVIEKVNGSPLPIEPAGSPSDE